MTITDDAQTPAPVDPSAAVTDEMIDAVMAGVDAGGLELLGPDGVLAELTKRILERGLGDVGVQLDVSFGVRHDVSVPVRLDVSVAGRGPPVEAGLRPPSGAKG